MNQTRIATWRRTAAVVCLAVALLGSSGCDIFVSPAERVERAEKSFAEGNYRAAMTELKTALQKEPDNAAARLALAKLSLWLGDYQSAERDLERASGGGADPAQVQALRYQLLLDRGQFDELESALQGDTTLAAERRKVLQARIALGRKDRRAARTLIDEALSIKPDDPEALLESARLAVAEGESEEALALPPKLTGSPDMQARAWFLRAAVLLNRGEFSDASQSLAEAAKAGRRLPLPEQLAFAAARVEADLAQRDIASAEKSVAQLTARAPKAMVTHYLRARVAMLKNDFVTAVAECQRALRIEPQHMQSQLLLASAHLAQGSLEQAQDVLTRLIASKPDTPAARKLLAQVYLARNKPAEAQRVLAEGGEADADTDRLMGAVLLRTGEIETGIEHLERSVEADPADMSRRIELASAYIAARAPQKAVELLGTVPQDSPQAPRAKALMVLASASGKPRNEARREVEDLVRKHPDDGQLLIVAGSFLAGAGDPAAGTKMLEKALELDPKNIDARLALARTHAAAKQMPQAEARLQEVLKIDPKSQWARLGLSQIAWARGDRAAAVKLLEDAIAADPSALEARLRLAELTFIQGDGARARGFLDQVLEVANDRRAALTATGQVLARAGMTDEALARLKEASTLGDANATLGIARLYVELGDLSNAREWAQKAVAGSGRDAEQLLVVLDAREGNVDRAYERARKLNPDASPAALASMKADLLALAGRWDQALKGYEEAQRQQPSAQTAIRIFEARRRSGGSEPERSLKDWLQRSPMDMEVHRVLVAYYEQAGDSTRALAEYERFAASGAVDPISLNNLAWTLHERGDAKALSFAQRAYEAAPQYPEIADTYGWILVRTDKVAEGVNVLKTALANAPGNPDIQYHLAYAYAKGGDVTQAAELLRSALASKSFASRADAEKLLESLQGSGA